MLTQKNSGKQGDVGLADAIHYFSSLNYTACIPVSDSQPFDLVVVNPTGVTSRIQVKTSRHYLRSKQQYLTHLGNYDKTQCDFLYVLTQDNTRFLIPTASVVGIQKLRLGRQYDQFKVTPRPSSSTFSSTKKKGDVGVAAAMKYYSSQGFNVSVPLTDTQPHDLLIDKGPYTYRVQVKTSKSTSINLAQYEGNLLKYFDYLFVLSDTGQQYSALTLSLPDNIFSISVSRLQPFLIQ